MSEPNLPAAQAEGAEHMLTTNENSQKLLTFALADEIYGIDIMKVQEIRGWVAPTQIPNAAAYVRGVINMRGAIVPIVDLRRRFDMEDAELTKYTVVIVVNVQNRLLGMVVDAVSDVADIEAEQMRPAPSYGTAIDASFLHGLAELDDKMAIILNIDALLMDEELTHLDDITEKAAT